MWRRNVTEVSNAEYELLQDLSNMGLNRLLSSGGLTYFIFNYDEDGVHGTSIDFFWSLGYCVFLDGEVHNSQRIDKDELITKALEKRGYVVDRFSYGSKLTPKRKNEILQAISDRLTGLGYWKEVKTP